MSPNGRKKVEVSAGKAMVQVFTTSVDVEVQTAKTLPL